MWLYIFILHSLVLAAVYNGICVRLIVGCKMCVACKYQKIIILYPHKHGLSLVLMIFEFTLCTLHHSFDL